jgi:MFS family permease
MNQDKQGVLTTLGAALGLAFGPSVIAILAISPFIPPIEEEFGWTRVQVSLAATLVSYMVVLVSPLQGWLVDRFGARKVILISIPLFASGLASLNWLQNSLTFYYLTWISIAVLGIGLWPLSYLQIVSRWFDKKLGLALGLANAGIGLGSTIVPLIIAILLSLYDWRTAFLGLASIVLLVTWPLAFLTIKTPSQPSVVADKMLHGKIFKAAVKEPMFILLSISFFLLGLTATSLVTQQVPLLIESGWTSNEAAFVQALFGFSLLFGRVFIGFLLDYVFAPKIIQAVTIGGSISCLLYAFKPDYAVISALLLGLLLGAEFDVLAFLIKRYFGDLSYGRIYGVIFGIFYLGSGLGITALASLRQNMGNYSTGLLTASAILLFCTLLSTQFKPYVYSVND